MLGQGGMGRVLLCAGPDGRLVAVKQVLAHFADDEGFRARFRREVAASRKVSGAYTAAVMDADPDAPTPWLASVFVSGPSLGAMVKTDGVLEEAVVHRLAAGLASALAEIHRAGLIHRDLKPDNVLLTEDGVRVIDLGIARVTEAEAEAEGDTGLTRTGWVIGSPSFMSPEQAESKSLTPASDVFSLGSLLVMAFTGSSPFAGTSTLRTLYDVVHSTPDLSAVPVGLRGIVERCLAKDPAARPTPAQLLELLGPVAPAGLQWPPAVDRMLAAQRADIDRLLSADTETVVAPPEPLPEPEPEREPESDEVVERAAGATESTPPSVVLPRPTSPPTEPASIPPRRRSRTVALVAAGMLVATGVGVGAYTLDRVAEGADPAAYADVPACQKATQYISLTGRDAKEDFHSANKTEVHTMCTWYDSLAGRRTALVRWDVKRGSDDGANARLQQAGFATDAARGKRVNNLGFGDGAYWESDGTTEWTCALSVRHGNLVVRVGLYHPGACEQKAKEVAKAALKAVPVTSG
ncbi:MULTISPECIES: serine/threonine-protein kinase [Streptomyces]|uniref:Serine/threonine protein kinase n=1 Tax=Streptomyces virginiae TaxID=1961 RepID=A0ABZ1THK7_STRVG|nr:serine/threonine-protein kinase [Streptomyces virginiae]WTB24913.1 serine/threonine protein kinase [Streptomyces virginiae]